MITLTSPAGRLSVNPDRGAKITSLRSSSGLEWLTTQPARVIERPGQYGFTDAEMCGWDECAPTINAAVLPDGRVVGDHGEVWDRPWQVSQASDTTLTTEVEDERLGFALTRTITATATGFRLDYRAEATGERELPWLWAAHPQFAMPADLRLELPGWGNVSVVYPEVGAHPVAAASLPLVGATTSTEAAPGRALKVWSTPDTAAPVPSRARLVRPDGRLEMAWGGEPIRGAALWFDPAVIAHTAALAVEPATGIGDDVTTLEPDNQVAVLRAGRPLEWWIELVLTD